MDLGSVADGAESGGVVTTDNILIATGVVPNIEDLFSDNILIEKTKDFITKSFSSDIKERNEVKDKLFNDLGDSMTFDKSMRNFYTTPITTIPNEQKTFRILMHYCNSFSAWQIFNKN